MASAHRTQSHGGDERPLIYCLVPRDLAKRLHEPLRRHFLGAPNVEVVVERRRGERRAAPERRGGDGPSPREERRKVRGAAGRRIAERRASALPVDGPPLPRKARPFADRLLFLERIEPSGLSVEDADSARLVTRFQAGERDVFNTVYLRYFDRIYGYLRVAVGDAVEAEDLTQQVFLAVLEGLDGYEQRGRPFRAWLFTIARNKAISQLRHQRPILTDPQELAHRRERLADERPAFAPSEPPVLEWISNRELQLFVERLPASQRQVLVLRFMVGLTSSETATVLGVSTDVVRKQQNRALSFLRQRLAAIGHTPRGPNHIGSRLPLRPSAVLRGRRFSLTGGPVR